jgi:hypothetical protein
VPPEKSIANTSIVTPDNYLELMDEISIANCGK